MNPATLAPNPEILFNLAPTPEPADASAMVQDHLLRIADLLGGSWDLVSRVTGNYSYDYL